jgi:D-sedoheptulose 7-phosphate isomerase
VFEFDAFFAAEMRDHHDTAFKTEEHLRDAVAAMLDAWEACVRGGGKILFFGNGGSAADAQHLATELVVRFKADRPAIAAIALTTDTSALTAGGNDFGFEAVFARQIEALGREGDLALGFSTSGNSPNVLKALEQAKSQGLATGAFTGGSGGRMVNLADHIIAIPSSNTARIQEMHITIGHILCGALEKRLGFA